MEIYFKFNGFYLATKLYENIFTYIILVVNYLGSKSINKLINKSYLNEYHESDLVFLKSLNSSKYFFQDQYCLQN